MINTCSINDMIMIRSNILPMEVEGIRHGDVMMG